MVGLDSYELRARLTPGYLAVAPIIASVVVLAVGHVGLASALVALATGLGLPFVVASRVRDRGKAIESDLWSSWGGAPATVMLRATATGPEVTSRRRRAQDRAGIALPSAAEQRSDGSSADRAIQAVLNVLIKQTRTDPVVQSELGDYGMRRNLLGVRYIGLLCSAAAFGLGIGELVWTLARASDNALPAVVVLVTAVVSGATWSRVSPDWVKVAADRYAAALLT